MGTGTGPAPLPLHCTSTDHSYRYRDSVHVGVVGGCVRGCRGEERGITSRLLRYSSLRQCYFEMKTILAPYFSILSFIILWCTLIFRDDCWLCTHLCTIRVPTHSPVKSARSDIMWTMHIFLPLDHVGVCDRAKCLHNCMSVSSRGLTLTK